MSRTPHWITWILVGSTIVLSAVGQLCMKAGMQAIADPDVVLPSALPASAVLWTGFGLVAYGISMLVWLGALTRLALSHAYPLLSISYILVYLGAVLWPRLQEDASPVRTGGTLLIALGVGLVCMSREAQSGDIGRLAGQGLRRPRGKEE